MIENTISAARAQRFYDWLGARHDLGERYERRAKQRALALLALRPGERVLNVGCGTGKEQAALAAALAPGPDPFALDLSMVMLRLTRQRTGCPVLQGDAGRLPFAAGSFDALFCSYVLDLMPASSLPGLMAEFRRVLKPQGRAALVSLTEGVDRPSRLVVAAWKAVYRLSPYALGGCRPVHLQELARLAGFTLLHHEYVVQAGVPSEIVVVRP